MSIDPDELPEGDETQHLARRFDSRTETATTAVLETIELHSGVDAIDLPPLSDRVNPDALNEFIDQAPPNPDGEALRVGFAYAGYWVVVRSDAHVTVWPHQTEDSDNGQ